MKPTDVDHNGAILFLRFQAAMADAGYPNDPEAAADVLRAVGLGFAGELDELERAGGRVDEGDHYVSWDLGHGLELALEPMGLGGWLVAVYHERELVLKHKLEVDLRVRRRDVDEAGEAPAGGSSDGP